MSAITRPTHGPRLMTQVEVQEYLQASASTVWRLIRDGKLPYLKIGTSKRFRLADVEAYLVTCQVRPQKGIGSSVGHGGKKQQNGVDSSP